VNLTNTIDPSTAERMANVVAALGETFDRPISEVTITAYCLALSDVPIDLVEGAAVRSMRELDRMPTAHKLREFACGVSDESRALLAWNAVLGAQLNPYRDMDFDDPLINATIRTLGGWVKFVDRMGGEDETWVRKEFLQAYRTFLASGVSADVCRPLPSLAKGGVWRDGKFRKPPVQRVACNLPALPAGKVLPAIGARERVAAGAITVAQAKEVEGPWKPEMKEPF